MSDAAAPINPSPSSADAMPELSPWALGFAAAKRNAVPAACLVAFAVSLGLSYAYAPPIGDAFDRLAAWRDGLPFPLSWAFPALSTALFGAVIPWLVQRLRADPLSRPTGRDLLFFTVFWAYKGLEIQMLYLVLTHLVGPGNGVREIALKTLLDMGFYCWVWAVPTTLVAYQFRDAGYSLGRLRRGPFAKGLRRWFLFDAMPVVVNNWLVWVPAVCVIYSVPLALQLPFQNLVLCFWALVMAFMSDALVKQGTAEPTPGA